MPVPEPFSITTGSLGIISFGISIYKDLYTYYKSWHAQDEEIQTLLTNFERGRKLLTWVQWSLQDSATVHDPGSAQVRGCIIEANDTFKRLERQLEKCRKLPAPDSARDKSRNVAKRFLFPFRKETLRDLNSAMSDSGRLLGQAVQLLHL